MPSCSACHRSVAEDWRKICQVCLLEQESAQAKEVARLKRLVRMQPGQGTGVAPDRIRELLQLCHPDKHAGSPLAHRVTSWLLKLRGE